MRTKKRYITLWRIDIDMLITSMFSLQLNIKINELENKKQFKCTWVTQRVTGSIAFSSLTAILPMIYELMFK
jgi:hypothetical protein